VNACLWGEHRSREVRCAETLQGYRAG